MRGRLEQLILARCNCLKMEAMREPHFRNVKKLLESKILQENIVILQIKKMLRRIFSRPASEILLEND